MTTRPSRAAPLALLALAVCARATTRATTQPPPRSPAAAAATPEGRERLVERFDRLPAKVDGELANLRAGLAAGYTAPRENVRRVIEQLDAIVPDDVARSPPSAPLRADSAPAFRDAWRREVETRAYPALRRYRDFLRDEYLARARTDPGLGALPDGAACYRAFVRAWTSLDGAPGELARVGREEARAALGPRFDLRAFHDVVLEDGSITLPMLRTKVRRWVAAELSRPAAGRRRSSATPRWAAT